MWTDRGWFIIQLEVRIVFDPRLQYLQLLVLELFHFVFSFFFFLWITDTIVFAKLSKAALSIKPFVSIY